MASITTSKLSKFAVLVVILGSVFAFSPNKPKSLNVFMIGDSTMANKKNPETNPEFGWGQVFKTLFNDQVTVINKAVNGRSTRSFISEGRWDSIYSQIKPGDYVFIQFGHNDQKEKDPKRFTNPYTQYRANLERFVNETRAKKGIPILCSSIVRRNFNEFGVLIDTHGAYPLVARMVAEDLNVPFIDLQLSTEHMEINAGVEDSKDLHLHFKPGENPYYPDGKDDDTHLSLQGATQVANMVVSELKKQIPDLAKYLK